jgi:hypothetical protein
VSYRLPVAIAAFVLASTLVVAVVIVASQGTTARPLVPTIPPARTAFPAPPPGAVVFAREAGRDALAVGIVPGSPLRLQASVVDQQGNGVSGLHVHFSVLHGGDVFVEAPAAPCGPGCYGARVGVANPQQVAVDVRGAGRRILWPVELPRTWPPPDASALVARAGRVWRGLKTLAFFDHIASDPQHAVSTHWKVVAPDRLAYRIEHGSSAVVIGGTRWDKTSGGTWQKSQSVPLQQPRPFWVAVSNAHVLGSGTMRGAQVWRVSFFDPRTQAWFETAFEKQTLRTLDLRMVTTAHFMHDVYGPFNAPVKIRPPG